MLARCFVLVLIADLGFVLPLAAQDRATARVAEERARWIEAHAADHAAAVATTVDAAAALNRAIEAETARRVAPFDLDWGMP